MTGHGDDTSADAATAAGRIRARGRVLIIAVALVLITALAFAIGRFSAFGMPTGPNAADVGFARDMQVHHAQAVEMAMIEYRGTADPDLRALSYDIATGQAGQGGEMYGWLVNWGLPQAGDPLMSWMTGTEHDHGAGDDATEEELLAQMGMATDAQLRRLRAASGTAQDCLFLDLMIRHHEGAIEMVDAVQQLGSDARVLTVSAAMGQTQQREIDAMHSARERLGCAG